MIKKTLDIKVDASTSFKHSEIVVDSSGLAVDLTAYTAKMQVRLNYGSDAVLAEATVGNGITLAADGRITFGLTGLQTTTLPLRCKYDLLLSDVSGEVYKLYEGNIEVSPTITKLP